MAVAAAVAAAGCGGGGEAAPDGSNDGGGGRGGTADGATGDGGSGAETVPGPKDPRSCTPLPASGACPDKLDTDSDLPDVMLGDGWTKARRLAPPVSAVGWEDGAMFDAGSVIWFGYSRADPKKAGALDPAAVTRCMQPGDRFSLWRATPGCDAAWHAEPLPAPLNAPPAESLAPTLTADRKALFLTLGSPDGRHRIALAIATDGVTFGTPAVQSFSAPAGAADCQDDNPSSAGDGTVVVFESNRDDEDATSCKGPRRLWRAARAAGGWQPPELVARAECSFTQGNLSPSGADLYFTVGPLGPGAGCPIAPSGGIWRVPVNGQPAPTGAAVLVAAATRTSPGGVVLVGDGSVDAIGKRLCFTTYREETDGRAEVDLALAERP